MVTYFPASVLTKENTNELENGNALGLGLIILGTSLIVWVRQNPQAHFENGHKAYELGNDDLAIREYTVFLRNNPTSAEAYSNRGLAYKRKKKYDQALADFSQAIELNPKNDSFYQYRGRVYYMEKNYNKALDDFNQALQINPGNSYGLRLRGLAYVHNKEYDKAIEDYNQAFHLDPRNIQAIIDLGYAYEHKKDFLHAQETYEKLLQLDPQNYLVYNNYAWFLTTCPQESFRNGKKAIGYATKACELTDWKEFQLVDTLAAAYAETGDFAHAIQWEEKVLTFPDRSPDDMDEEKKCLELYQEHKPYRLEYYLPATF